MPALIRGLERSSNIWEKVSIAEALGNIGPAAKDALSLIEKAKSQILSDAITDDERQSPLQRFSNAESQIRSSFLQGPSSIAPPVCEGRLRQTRPFGEVVAGGRAKPPSKDQTPPKADCAEQPMTGPLCRGHPRVAYHGSVRVS